MLERSSKKQKELRYASIFGVSMCSKMLNLLHKRTKMF